jgi:DNA-directed RNA polymerase specialized sigma24 family protein
MQIELSPDDIETIIREADTAARRLRRRLQLQTCDREDLGQDLLVDLLRRLSAYDPSRGSIGAFAGLILRNQSSRIAIGHHHARRAQCGTLLSLDAPIAGGTEPLGCLLAEADGLPAWHGQGPSAADDADLRHDLARALGDLPEDARTLCAALGTCAIAEIVDRTGTSRSAVYRHVAQLRLDLAMRGFGAQWDGSRAA